MRKEDLPQDESSLKSANMTEVVYVTDENNNYTTANSTGWNAKKMALDESMALIEERIEEARLQVQNRTASPILYFMELNKMDVAILASYVNMWQWRVKRHFRPAVFKKLNLKQLEKYALAFGITIDELLNFDGK